MGLGGGGQESIAPVSRWSGWREHIGRPGAAGEEDSTGWKYEEKTEEPEILSTASAREKKCRNVCQRMVAAMCDARASQGRIVVGTKARGRRLEPGMGRGFSVRSGTTIYHLPTRAIDQGCSEHRKVQNIFPQ